MAKEMSMQERFFIPPMIFFCTAGVLHREYEDLADKSFTSWGQWLFAGLAVVSLAWAIYYSSSRKTKS
jgi:hypothetical protein